MRMLVHKDRGRWEEFGPAFYTAHLELFLGNGCLGKTLSIVIQNVTGTQIYKHVQVWV